MSTEIGQQIQQRPSTRVELIRQLLARLDRLASRLGDVSLAAEIQLFKRDLARGHPILSARPEDNNFLSVVALVEAALASLTWKDYTPLVLDALRQALAAGVREGNFSFEEYDAIRRDFKATGIPTGPTISAARGAGTLTRTVQKCGGDLRSAPASPASQSKRRRPRSCE